MSARSADEVSAVVLPRHLACRLLRAVVREAELQARRRHLCLGSLRSIDRARDSIESASAARQAADLTP